MPRLSHLVEIINPAVYEMEVGDTVHVQRMSNLFLGAKLLGLWQGRDTAIAAAAELEDGRCVIYEDTCVNCDCHHCWYRTEKNMPKEAAKDARVFSTIDEALENLDGHAFGISNGYRYADKLAEMIRANRRPTILSDCTKR